MTKKEFLLIRKYIAADTLKIVRHVMKEERVIIKNELVKIINENKNSNNLSSVIASDIPLNLQQELDTILSSSEKTVKRTLTEQQRPNGSRPAVAQQSSKQSVQKRQIQQAQKPVKKKNDFIDDLGLDEFNPALKADIQESQLDVSIGGMLKDYSYYDFSNDNTSKNSLNTFRATHDPNAYKKPQQNNNEPRNNNHQSGGSLKPLVEDTYSYNEPFVSTPSATQFDPNDQESFENSGGLDEIIGNFGGNNTGRSASRPASSIKQRLLEGMDGGFGKIAI